MVSAPGATNVKSVAEVAVPPGVLTEIATVPAVCAAVLATILVVPVIVKLAAAVVPNLTDVAPLRLAPLMVTVVPPSVDPLVGVKLVIVGVGTTNLKKELDVAVPPGVVTLILTVPAACAAVLATILLLPVTVKLAAGVVPNVTDVAPFRFVPVIVTVVPP
jgi:hypothetical protein